MTVEEREQRWAEAMRAERRGGAVAYGRMLQEVATALRRSLAPRLVRAGLGAHEAEDLVQEILIGLHAKRDTWDSARPFLPWWHAPARKKFIDSRATVDVRRGGVSICLWRIGSKSSSRRPMRPITQCGRGIGISPSCPSANARSSARSRSKAHPSATSLWALRPAKASFG